MLEYQDFIATVATSVKKKTKKTVDAGSAREDRRRKCFDAACNTGAGSASLGDQLPTKICQERTNRKAYFQMSVQQALDLPPWNYGTIRSTAGQYKYKPEKDLDVPGVEVLEPVDNCFAAAVNCQDYRLLKKSSRNDHIVVHKLHKMSKKLALQMKDRTLSRKNPKPVIAFLEEFKSPFVAC